MAPLPQDPTMTTTTSGTSKDAAATDAATSTSAAAAAAAAAVTSPTTATTTATSTTTAPTEHQYQHQHQYHQPPPRTCEELYGPYPSSIPIPFLSAVSDEGRSGVTPDATVVQQATSQFSMPSDVRDLKSPDAWIPRDGRLIRLTGQHPFNVEPPVSVHNQHQFLTPASLHYVRNHGAVPHRTWDDHTVTVSAAAAAAASGSAGSAGSASASDVTTTSTTTTTFSMDQIAAMRPVRELPVTLVCAGNRRKEQNMIRQTIGFNWGSSGVSTNVWKGVLLRDVLIQAGVVSSSNSHDYASMRGRHVEFVGVEDLPNKVGPGPFPDAPWGKLVRYGTSVPLARAMNPAYDILIAYEANGERLQPDHGFPVRLIIPGYIGGRMVKWLAQINVLPHESKNHYHYHDNRILPPHVTAEDSLTGNWWYQPEYIFNELCLNSSVTQPDHNETLAIAANIGTTYRVGGYAYTGGGRRITRVEVSIDDGAHWMLASIQQKEQATDHGMYWCWVWWTFDLAVVDLVGCREIKCRAWDESNNCQPDHATWNLMGMGNNQCFKVLVHTDQTASGEHVFRFEHPTRAGQQTGGWMSRAAGKPVSAGFGKLLEVQDGDSNGGGGDQAPPAPPPKKKGDKVFTLAEVEQHNTEDDCWIIIKDRVYDATEYLDMHPGGVESITMNAGQDATEDYYAIHSSKAHKMLEKWFIGTLDVTAAATAAASNTVKKGVVEEGLMDAKGNKLALNPRKKTPFKLQNKVQLSRDTIMLDFALPTKDHILGLPTGKHMFLSANIGGEVVLRRYTPISSNYDIGCVKFVIKVYSPCERFPEGGKMSQYVNELKIGDSLDMKGPVGEFEYSKNGNFKIEGDHGYASKFNMLAGGTGITPVMQIASEILRHPEDPTEMSLIFACREEGDLLMRSTLDEWAANFPKKFKVHYILSDKCPKDWKFSTGFVDKALFDEYLHPASDDCYNLMCGPPIMLERGCSPNLEALGHKKSNIFSF